MLKQAAKNIRLWMKARSCGQTPFCLLYLNFVQICVRVCFFVPAHTERYSFSHFLFAVADSIMMEY